MFTRQLTLIKCVAPITFLFSLAIAYWPTYVPCWDYEIFRYPVYFSKCFRKAVIPDLNKSYCILDIQSGCETKMAMSFNDINAQKTGPFRLGNFTNKLVRFSGDGSVVAMFGDDNAIRLWECKGGNLLWKSAEFDDIVTCIALSEAGDIIAFTLTSGCIHIVDWGKNKTLWVLRANEVKKALNMAFLLCNSFLVASYSDNLIGHWDLNIGKMVDSYKTSTKVTEISPSPHGKSYLLGYDDGTIEARELNGGNLIYKNKKMSNSITSINHTTSGDKYVCTWANGRVGIYTQDGKFEEIINPIYPAYYGVYTEQPIIASVFLIPKDAIVLVNKADANGDMPDFLMTCYVKPRFPGSPFRFKQVLFVLAVGTIIAVFLAVEWSGWRRVAVAVWRLRRSSVAAHRTVNADSPVKSARNEENHEMQEGKDGK